MAALLALSACAAPGHHAKGGAASPFPRWIDGTDPAEPEVQIHAADADTFILRQSLRTSFEGPFLYLFVGEKRALLVDSGAGGIDLARVVRGLLEPRSKTRPTGAPKLELVVAHSHAHGDHVAGDGPLAALPRTTVVGRSPAEVAAFFGIERWPEQTATLDLGGRVIDVIPIPGHEASHLAFYDRRTKWLITGDSLYPGRLYVPTTQAEAFAQSLERLAAFAEKHPVRWVLGTHVEMTSAPGVDFPHRAESHPDERRLELTAAHLLELRDAARAFAASPRRDVHDDFILVPIAPRGR